MRGRAQDITHSACTEAELSTAASDPFLPGPALASKHSSHADTREHVLTQTGPTWIKIYCVLNVKNIQGNATPSIAAH